jgi:pyruvate dehydrogenase E1 component beta subunit
LNDVRPQRLRYGSDLTIVSSGYSTLLATQAADLLLAEGIHCDVVDLRVLNPLDISLVVDSVKLTHRLLVVDSGWKSAGFSAEVVSSTLELIPPSTLSAPPVRVALPDAPAPTSSFLESQYYPTVTDVLNSVRTLFA